jgi:DNA sulfur modification protein DndB
MTTYVLPAIRGHIGSTTYYTVTMTSRELAAVACPANELSEWKQWTISERIQRDVGVNRVRDELIPYLLESRDRFFGSLIVIAYQTDLFEFEPIDVAGTKIPGAYHNASSRMGFLTIEGGTMVALDGQHRLVGLREIVNGKCQASPKKIAAIADDEICIVFIKFESLEKTRRIFNKVNRHARPTTPHDNILTSEDDGYAIVTRWLLDEEPPLGLAKPAPPLALFDSQGEPLVEWNKTNLPQFTEKLTTLSAVYQTVEVICDVHGLANFDEKHRVNRPSNDELRHAYTWSANWWHLVLDGLEPFNNATTHPYLIPDMRQYREKWSLLFRPVAQVALFRGIGHCAAHRLSLHQAIQRMNRINWRASAHVWQDIIIRANGRMVATQQAIRLAGRLIAYLVAADKMPLRFIDQLTTDYALARGWTPHHPGKPPGLPKPRFAQQR